jgi:anti-sigma factor RsiW
MRVTQDVVTDLLPVYLAGEASADTRDLVEEFLRENPEFAAMVESERREFGGQQELLTGSGAPSADHELRTLTRTRSLMERQKWQMATALMLAAFPFSFVSSGGHLTFLLVRDQPVLAAAAWGGAGIVWVLYFRTRRKLRKAGL